MNEQQEFFVPLLNPGQPPPSGLTTGSGSNPKYRFAVYRNNVVVSLIDALVETFPVTIALVGEGFFRAMAKLFVYTEPPRSPILTFYGESFPAFIENVPSAASVPYLSDVAQLEMLRVHAYYAADSVEFPTDSITQALANIDELPNFLVSFHPSVRFIRSQYSVVSLWEAHQGIVDISTVDPYISENALVIRSKLEVEVIRLNDGESDFVGHLLHGASLGYSAEQASNTHANFDLTSILSLLIQMHAITSIKTTGKTYV